MVSNYIIGMALSALIGVGGTLAMGYLNVKRGKMEQKAENERVRAELMAEKETEAIQDLSTALEMNYRFYQTAVRRAANNNIDFEEFEKDINGGYKRLQESVEKAMVFLSDEGEDALTEHLYEVIGANMYIEWKANQERPSRKISPEEALSEEEIPSSVNFNWNRFNQSYQLAKEGLRKDVRKRLKPFINGES